MLTSEQIRAARAILRMEQRQLAERAGVSLETIKRIERTPGPVSAHSMTLENVQKALEKTGVVFVPENGDGPGVETQEANVSQVTGSAVMWTNENEITYLH